MWDSFSSLEKAQKLKGWARVATVLAFLFVLTACAGSDECTVDNALLDPLAGGLLICGGDTATIAGLRATLRGDAGWVVVAEPVDEPGSAGPLLVGPDEGSGLSLARVTETRAYEVTDPLGSDLTGRIDVIAWNGDAYISDETGIPICLDPPAIRSQLLQCDVVGQSHAALGAAVVLFLANDEAGLVLIRRARLTPDGAVYLPLGAPEEASLESLRL